MQHHNGRFRLVVVGAIAFLLLGTVVWAAPPLGRSAAIQLAVSPFEIEGTSEIADNGYLQFLHHWLGYTEVWSSGDPNDPYQGTIFIPVHTPIIFQNRPLKLEGMEVCYQVTPGSYISRSSVFYADRGGGRTQILDSDVVRSSDLWTCYTVTPDTPQLVEGPLMVYFILNFGGSDSSHKVTIGQITLTLTR